MIDSTHFTPVSGAQQLKAHAARRRAEAGGAQAPAARLMQGHYEVRKPS